MLDLTIVRHGQCLAQCEPSAQGDPDSALSPVGEQQARRAGERLSAMQVTHLVSSPLLRTLDTAQIIAETVGMESVEVWMQIREGFSGSHRGYGRMDLTRRYPRASLPAALADDGWAHGDDTYDSFFARAQETVMMLRDRFATSDHVVLVTHGGFANYLLHVLLQIRPSTPTWFELANGSLTRIRFPPPAPPDEPVWPLYPPVGVEVLSVNEVGHL
jgi:broad specificity phosphatase PhoE